MKRIYLNLSAAALLLSGLLAPAASFAQSRVMPDGSPAGKKQVKVSVEGRKQLAKLRKMMKSAGTSDALGTVGSLEFSLGKANRPTNHMTRSAIAPRGKAYTIVPSHMEGAGYEAAKMGVLDFATGNFTTLYHGREYSLGEEYNYLTSVIVDGIMYIPEWTQDMVTGEVTSGWRRIDIETGEQLSTIRFGRGDDMVGFNYALAYNENTKKFYGLSLNLTSGQWGEFYEYDITGTPTATYLGNTDNNRTSSMEQGFLASLVWNPADGKLYGIKDSGVMFIVDQTANPRLTSVYEFDNNADGEEIKCIPEEDLPSPLCYSPRDGAFVTIYRNSFDMSMDIMLIDAKTFEVVPGNSTSLVGYYCSLNCNEPYAADDAPAAVDFESVNVDKASLSGNVVVTTSNEVYGGGAITDQKLTVVFSIDGETVSTVDADGGQQLTIPFTTTQGLHTFTVQPVFNGTLKGPESRKIAWIGNDNPVAPTGIALSDDLKLTWNKVLGPGAHDGYVDADAVTYNVYVNEGKQNSAPITDTSYTLTFPGELSRRQITVTAVANGLESEKSSAISRVSGTSLTLPVSLRPEAAEGPLFESYDANHDGTTFGFVGAGGGFDNAMGIFMSDYTKAPDDWLFLPQIYFDSKEHLYQLAFQYSNYYTSNEKQQSNIKVYIGKQPRPDAMTQLIYERESDSVRTPLDIETLFAVDEPGEYYIGFYTGFAVNNNSRGARLWDFRVNSLENISTSSPGAPEDVVVAPGDNGDFYAKITCKYPTKTIGGDPLDPNTDVTILAAWEEQEVQKTGKPGETCELRLPIETDGFAFFDLMTVVDGQRINRRNYRVYIGVDVPSRPTNVKGVPSANNQSITLTWDAPTVGSNGGWIDPADLTYKIYTRSGIAYSSVGESRTTSFTFTPSGSEKQQSSYYVGPSAVSRKGESLNNSFIYDFIGKLYEVPMAEEYTQTTSTSFMLRPWTARTDLDFGNCSWSHITDATGLGIGDPVLVGGAFICSRLDGGHRGHLNAPKATTKDANDVRLGLRYWDYPEAAKFEVWGRRYGHEEEELVFTIEPQRPALENAQWIDWNEELPAEYQDCEWVQLNVRCYLPSSNSYLLLDNYRLYRDVDHDFRITDVSAPSLASIGDKVEFQAQVSNSGLEAGTSKLVLRVEAGDKLLGKRDIDIRRIASGASYNSITEWEIKPEYLEYEKLTFSASIEDPDDEVANNNVKSVDVAIRKSVLPAVTSVSGKWNDDHNAVTISWDEPSTEYGEWESFEYDNAFDIVDHIGQWQNIDMDGLPQFAIENMRWIGDDEPSGWVVVNGDELKIMNDERFAPHNGKQMLMARSVSYDQTTEKPVQSADWLISPPVVGDTEISFWYGTGSSQYTETIELWYTTSTDTTLGDEIVNNNGNWTCGSWKRVCNFTKSGTDTWEKVTAKLPAETVHFALVYRSWGQFCAMIDELEFTPRQLSNWEIDSYDVYRQLRDGTDNYTLVGGSVKGRSFTDENAGDNNVSYYINTNVMRDGNRFTGPRSNELRMFSLGVDDIDILSGIAGGNGEIIVNGLAGNMLDVYTADGKYIRSVRINDARQTIDIDAALYIVKCGNRIAKVVVK